MKLPKELTTVTPLSKNIALLLFATLPIVGFLMGMRYQQAVTQPQNIPQTIAVPSVANPSPAPSVPTNLSTSYHCAPKFDVESGPELTASESYSYECTKQQTKEACEAVDIFRESTYNFGNSDGIPDCSWVAK